MSNGKFCTYCGAKNAADNQFCENCGQTFDEITTSSQSQQPSQFTPYQKTSTHESRSSMSGSYNVLPTAQQQYSPQKHGLPTAVKVLLILFFFGLPLVFFLIFFVFAGIFPGF